MTQPEWLDAGKGRSVYLPASTTKEATWYAQLLLALIAPHVTHPIPEAWQFDGDEALIERTVQSIMDGSYNDALYQIEAALYKERK